MTPHRRRCMTVAAAVALLAGTGMPALPAVADPITPQGDAVTVIIPVTEDAITVTVSRAPADSPTSTTPLVTPRPPAPRPDAPLPAPAPAPATAPAPVAAATTTTAPAPAAPQPSTTAAAAPPTVDAVTITPTAPMTGQLTPQTATVPASPPVATGALPTPAPTQAPPQHTQTVPAATPAGTGTPATATLTQGTETTSPTATATLTPAPGAAPQAQRSAPTSQEATAVQASEGRASGMPWRSGVFAHSLDRVARYEQKIGRPVDTLAVSPARGSWDTILDTWWMARPSGFQGTLDVAVPLWQEDGDLATAAAGGYNQQWQKLGATIEAEYPGSTVRMGWEFNLGGWKHHATPENVEQWKQAFRHASQSLKQGGPSLLVSWNPNKGRGDSLPNAADAWPGDDVVDIVAIDAYDWWPAYNEQTWPEHRDGDQGWKHWVEFARQHGKKFGVPEWGVAPGNSNGGGDNPYFIKVVTDFLAAEHAKDGIVHHALYFDEPESYIANSLGDGQVPQAGQALAEAMSQIAASPAGAAAQAAPTGQPAPSPTAPATAGPATASSPPPAASDSATPPASAPAAEPAQTPTPAQSQSLVPVDLAPPSPSTSTTPQAEAWNAPDSGAHGPTPQG